MQVANFLPRVLPSLAPEEASPRTDAERLPTDTDRDACMNLYRKAAKLRDSGKFMPGTKQRYPCVGMAQICRQYEDLHGLVKNSLIERTLRKFV